MPAMAQIMISQPRLEARRQLQRMVLRLGMQPVFELGPSERRAANLSALIVEPADPIGGVLAAYLQSVAPSLPIVCASVAPAPDIGITFAGSLVEPFTLPQLRRVLERAGVIGGSRRE